VLRLHLLEALRTSCFDAEHDYSGLLKICLKYTGIYIYIYQTEKRGKWLCKHVSLRENQTFLSYGRGGGLLHIF